MSDTTASVRVKSENSPAAGHFAMPKIEFPENLREFAEEAMAQTRGNYERIEAAANDLGERASKHAVDCGQKHRELSNLDDEGRTRERYRRLRICPRHEHCKVAVGRYGARERARARYDALAAQTKELNELSRNFVTEIGDPINTSIANARKGAV
jgi:hypothetical protein